MPKPEMNSGTLAYEEVELSSIRGCVGRLYFKIPGGLKYGQHFLNVQFQDSLVRVPFRIMTAEEEKILSKNYPDLAGPLALMTPYMRRTVS